MVYRCSLRALLHAKLENCPPKPHAVGSMLQLHTCASSAQALNLYGIAGSVEEALIMPSLCPGDGSTQCIFKPMDPGTAAQRREHRTCVWCDSDRLRASVASRTAMGNFTRSLDAFASNAEVWNEANHRIHPFVQEHHNGLRKTKKQRCADYKAQVKQAEKDRLEQEAKEKLEGSAMLAEDHRTHKWMT